MCYHEYLFDPIEAQFGCYWQMNDGNLLMSLQQLLDSEKKDLGTF